MKQIILNEIETGIFLKRYPSTLPSTEDIEGFEAKLGFVLPEHYFDFLLKYNGGTCRFGNVIEALDAVIVDLYCFDIADQSYCIPLRYPKDYQEEWEGIENNILPIGEMDSGDLIAIKFNDTESQIVIISHEDDSLRTLYAMPTFIEFLSNTIPN